MIINANALSIPLADKSVHTIVTSPPYYGLRDYGTATWQGGDVECKHTISMPTKWNDPKRGYDVLRPEVANRGGDSTRCHLCGAIRIDEQIGLEVTPDAYIANLVEVFRECKRILRDDGTLWVNIGDSYCNTNGYARAQPEFQRQGRNDAPANDRDLTKLHEAGFKTKDLIGIPWMLAFALRADGWYLRQDIIWAKPNPMPESVKDRCTKSHEYIFLLSKSAKYYYDSDAVKEPAAYDGRKDEQFKGAIKSYDGVMPNGQPQSFAQNGHPRWNKDENGLRVRNKRDVWTVTTKPYKGAHYATFNPELIKPCILAGAPETCCAKCGAPYERVVERVSLGKRYSTGKSKEKNESGLVTGFSGYDDGSSSPVFKTIGFEPTCTCNAGTSSGIVFDPFVGSGTTVATAIQLGRKGIGLDLSLTYLYENAKDRIKAEMLPLLTLIEQE